MTEITSISTNTQPPARQGNAFTAAASDLGKSIFPILKLAKTGQWVSGPENTPMPETLYAADVEGSQVGFTCFVDGNVADEIMLPVALGRKISPDELPDHGPYQDGDGWKPSASIQLKAIETGEQFIFKPTSHGGLSAISALLSRYGHRLDIGKGGIPIVELKVDSYEHKRYGKIYKPSFRIKLWREEADLVDGGAVKLGEELHDDKIPF